MLNLSHILLIIDVEHVPRTYDICMTLMCRFDNLDAY